MSGLDPLTTLAAQAAEAQSLIQETALNLGIAADLFETQLNIGDILNAVVLPPQNGSDRLSVLGQTVAAQLPPGINPGESIVLQVTGFAGQQIFVKNLGPADPQNLPTATVLTKSPQTQSSSAVAPPREIFVAASVRPQNSVQQSAANEQPNRANASPLQGSDGDVELRLAINRTATTRAVTSPVPPAPLRMSPPVPPPLLGNQPVSISKSAVAVTPQSQLLTRLRVPISSSTLVAARLIDDAARHLSTSYQRLDQALGKLSATDPRIGSLRSLLSFVGKMDLRNSRSLPEQIASFVSHVVGGAESKVAQIVRALTAVAAEAALLEQNPVPATEQNSGQVETPSFTAAQASNAPSDTPLSGGMTSAVVAPADIPPAVAARVVERTVALDHDVKTAIMALVQNPPREMTPATMQALSSSLGATTALQLNVLLAQNNDPSTIAIPLPAYFYEGGKPAHIAISRDAPNRGAAMDADNFHVSFVLDTKTMGTVAIDLQTVGRAVSINVKTERQSAASRFRSSLTDLRGRLEQLRYRVASMAADVAPPRAARDDVPVSPLQPRPSKSNVDLRA